MAVVPDPAARNWGALCHLASLIGLFLGSLLLIGLPFGLPCCIPFGNLWGPLAVWLSKRDNHPFVDEQGKNSMNFQISVTIYGLVASMLVLILSLGVSVLLGLSYAGWDRLVQDPSPWGVGLLLICGLGVLAVGATVAYVVVVIMAAAQASKGESYRYPLTMSFLR